MGTIGDNTDVRSSQLANFSIHCNFEFKRYIIIAFFLPFFTRVGFI